MAYPIKNTGVVQTNSIKPNNFALGVNQGGYGLTSVTAFWNGRPPNVTGYIVYVGNGTSSPTMYTVATDSDLIQLSNTLGGGSNNTIQLALNYFINSADSICLNNEPLNIVTSGLVLYFDAGFTPSFPKGFNTWYDLSGSGNTGTLVNGPSYNSTNYGSISFDGTNDYVNCGNILDYTTGDFTFSYWVYITDLQNANGGSVIIYKGDTSVNGYSDFLDSTGEIQFRTNTAGPTVVTETNTGVISTGNTYNITYTRVGTSIKIYVNGVNVTLTSGVHANPVTSSSNFTIGAYSGTSFFSNKRLYSFYNYNRGLSAAEVLQNYYAGLQRFIPTDGLSLWLDGQNTNTRVITPTTAYDTSGNNYNGTLTNGVILKHRDAGTVFSFDGVDDYILVTGPLLQDSGGTINVWVKVAASPSDANIVGAVGSGANRFYIRSSFPSSTFKFVRGTTFTITSGSFTLNTWYNLTMTWNSSTFNAYLNGNLLANLAYTSVNTTTNVIYVGAQSNTANFFNGNVGEIQIYSRVLTATEILSNYTADKTRYGL